MMLKGTKKSMKTISRELGIRYALEGSARKAGNSLRITVQLIDAFDILVKRDRCILDDLELPFDVINDNIAYLSCLKFHTALPKGKLGLLHAAAEPVA